MAYDDNISEDDLNDLEGNTEGSETEGAEGATSPSSTEPAAKEHVTRAQWITIGILGFVVGVLYFIVPFFLDETILKKNPSIYKKNAIAHFEQAHTNRSNPRGVRLQAFYDVIWNYEAALSAGGNFNRDERFRWGYAGLQYAYLQFPDSIEAFDKPVTQLKQALALSGNGMEATDEKIEFLLGQAYLHVNNPDRALVYFEALHRKKWEMERYLRGAKRRHVESVSGPAAHMEQKSTPAPFALGENPYLLSKDELFDVDLRIGKAYYLKKDASTNFEARMKNLDQATAVLKDYLLNQNLEDKRKNVLGSIEADSDSRFQALKLLGTLYWEKARQGYLEVKKRKAAKAPASAVALVEEDWKGHLKNAQKYLEELHTPRYKVNNIEDETLKLAEVCYRLGNIDRTLALSEDYFQKDKDKVYAMRLWRVLALLQKKPQESVASTLASVAGASIDPEVQLAAWMILGDSQQALNDGDQALGALLPDAKLPEYKNDPRFGSYLNAAKFDEALFDTNPFVDKLSLVNYIINRARDFRWKNGHPAEKDLLTAIRLYNFLLAHFDVPKAELLHQIARLQRSLASLKLEDTEKELFQLPLAQREDIRSLFKASAETFLLAFDQPYDKQAYQDAFFEAAESFFEGHFYTKAYANYQSFLRSQADDIRNTKAMHKMGLAALHRKRETRFQEAEAAFIRNVSTNVRENSTNATGFMNVLVTDRKHYEGSTKKTLREELLAEKVDISDIEPDGVDDIVRAPNGKSWIIPPSEEKEELVSRLVNYHLLKLLKDTRRSSRDIWSYASLLELGHLYHAQHNYDQAKLVYERILNDPIFTPAATEWREAACKIAIMTYDQVSENEKKKVKDWPRAIQALKDVLMRYQLSVVFPAGKRKDQKLFDEIRTQNAELQFRLALAHYQNGEPQIALGYLQEMLNYGQNTDGKPLVEPDQAQNFSARFILSEDQKRRTNGLLADAFFKTQRYSEALEQYRLAHDKHMESFLRPFYSLSMAECYLKLGQTEDAIAQLDRTLWEFESKEVFKEDLWQSSGQDPLPLADSQGTLNMGAQNMDRQYWVDFVKNRQQEIKGGGA